MQRSQHKEQSTEYRVQSVEGFFCIREFVDVVLSPSCRQRRRQIILVQGTAESIHASESTMVLVPGFLHYCSNRDSVLSARAFALGAG